MKCAAVVNRQQVPLVAVFSAREYIHVQSWMWIICTTVVVSTQQTWLVFSALDVASSATIHSCVVAWLPHFWTISVKKCSECVHCLTVFHICHECSGRNAPFIALYVLSLLRHRSGPDPKWIPTNHTRLTPARSARRTAAAIGQRLRRIT